MQRNTVKYIVIHTLGVSAARFLAALSAMILAIFFVSCLVLLKVSRSGCRSYFFSFHNRFFKSWLCVFLYFPFSSNGNDDLNTKGFLQIVFVRKMYLLQPRRRPHFRCPYRTRRYCPRTHCSRLLSLQRPYHFLLLQSLTPPPQ